MTRSETVPLARSLAPYVAHLRALPFVHDVRLLPPRPHLDVAEDARIELRTDGGAFEFSVEIKTSHITSDVAGWMASRARSSRERVLLFAPAVGRPSAERFAAAKVNFVDRAGNCFLALDDKFAVRIEGRRGPARVDRAQRALRAPAHRVLFALLARPSLVNAPLRAIAASAGKVSAQTVSDLRADLVERAILSAANRRYEWNAARWNEALDLFAHGYLTGLRDHLLLGRYRAKERDPRSLEDAIERLIPDEVGWAFGGGAAAMRMTAYYRGERTVVHVDEPSPDLARRLRLIPDPTGNVSLQRAPGPLALDGPAPRVAHPLLAYVDLLAEANERAAEAAEVLRNRYLASPEYALT